MSRRGQEPDVVIVPEGQIAEVMPEALVEALLSEQPEAPLDPRWIAARDAFVASMGTEWGEVILDSLTREVLRRKDSAKESAKDLRQLVLIVLSRKYERHVLETGEAWEPDHPEAFVRSVSRNVARNHFKMKERRPEIERGLEVDAAPGVVPDPEQAALLAETLEQCEGQLTQEEKEVFEARELLGLSFPVIASLVQRPLVTVHRQHARARAKLQAFTRASGEGEDEGTGAPEAGDEEERST
jgi:RNA polymerase sigma factor (sigma-70 family)